MGPLQFIAYNRAVQRCGDSYRIAYVYALRKYYLSCMDKPEDGRMRARSAEGYQDGIVGRVPRCGVKK